MSALGELIAVLIALPACIAIGMCAAWFIVRRSDKKSRLEGRFDPPFSPRRREHWKQWLREHGEMCDDIDEFVRESMSAEDELVREVDKHLDEMKETKDRLA